MSQNLRRLEKIEAALEQLLAKDKVYLLFYRGNDPEKSFNGISMLATMILPRKKQ